MADSKGFVYERSGIVAFIRQSRTPSVKCPTAGRHWSMGLTVVAAVGVGPHGGTELLVLGTFRARAERQRGGSPGAPYTACRVGAR